MGRSLRLPSSTSPPSRNTIVRNPSPLGSKLQAPSGRSGTGLASIGATGGITGRSMPPVSGTGPGRGSETGWWYGGCLGGGGGGADQGGGGPAGGQSGGWVR